jgi:rhodanese-related sulfurtransferase
MLIKIRRSLRPLPVLLSILAFTVGALSVLIAVNGFDIQTMIVGMHAKHITVAELKQGKLKPIILIDVRSPEEYAEDRIVQSQLVSITEIEMGLGVKRILKIVEKSVKPDQPQPTVVLYCTKGPRSVKAYGLLEKTGLRMAVLSGGITSWRESVSAAQDKAVLSPIILPANRLRLSSDTEKVN